MARQARKGARGLSHLVLVRPWEARTGRAGIGVRCIVGGGNQTFSKGDSDCENYTNYDI